MPNIASENRATTMPSARHAKRIAADAERHSAPRSPSSAERAPRADRPRREAAQPRRDDDAPVIGLGDHVPDFLLRPVKARPRTTPEPVEAKE